MQIKKVLTALCAAMLIAVLLPVSASAAATSGYCGDTSVNGGKNVRWSLSNGTLTITGSGDMRDYNISSSYTTPEWNESKSSIVRIVIEKGVTRVGSEAFYEFGSLTSVTLPDGLTSIGSHAFHGCANSDLTDIKLPATLTSFGEGAFYDMAYLHMITIPSGVTELPDYLFNRCQGLYDIAIPKTVKKVSTNTFYNTVLCDVHYEGTQAEWEKVTNYNSDKLATARIHYNASVKYVPYVKGKTCGRGLTYTLSNGTLTVSGTGWMFDYTTGSSYSAVPWEQQRSTITAAVLQSGVKRVGSYAFYNCSKLASVSLPEGLTSIGDSAFYGCASSELTDLRLPATLTSIGKSAFYGMTYLHMITIPSGVTELPDYLFNRCQGLYDIAIPKTVKKVSTNTFYNTPLCDVHYEGTAAEWKKITNYNSDRLGTARIHYGASMAYVPYIEGKTCGRGLTYTLSNGKLTVSGTGWMFDYTTGSSYSAVPWEQQRSSITAAVLKSGVKRVGNYAFYNCSKLASVTLPDGLTSIGDSAFYGCASSSLTDLKLPATLTSIGASAFYGMTYLHMITIPSGVTELPDYLFNRCQGLYDIAIPKTVKKISTNTFYNTVLCDVHYEGTAAEWKEITNYNSDKLATARIHYNASVTYVPYVEGKTCGRGLTWALSDGTLTVSGTGWMFDYTTGSSYSAVPWEQQRSSITAAVLQSGVKGIGAYAFYYAGSLTDVTIPRSLGVIGKNAFFYCSGLTDVWYGGTETDRYELIAVHESGNNRLEHKDCTWHYTDAPTVLPFTIDALEVLSADGAKLNAIPKAPCFVSVTITRISDEAENARVLVAAYDANGRFLSGLMYVRVGVGVGASATFELPVDNSAGEINTFKAFVVSASGSLVPLGEAVAFPN